MPSNCEGTKARESRKIVASSLEGINAERDNRRQDKTI